jgi:hypothetical protein
MIERDTSEKLHDNLRSSSNTIGIYLETIQLAANNLLLDDNVQRHVKPYREMTDENRANLTKVMREFNAFRNNFNHFIDELFVYNDTDKVYSGAGVSDFDTFFNKFYIFEQYGIDFWSRLNRSESFIEFLPPSRVRSNLNIAERVVIPIRTSQYLEGNLTTLVATITTKSIENVLTGNSIYPETDYFILDQQGRLLLTTGRWEQPDIEAFRSAFAGGEPADGYRQMKLGDNAYTVVHVESGTFFTTVRTTPTPSG